MQVEKLCQLCANDLDESILLSTCENLEQFQKILSFVKIIFLCCWWFISKSFLFSNWAEQQAFVLTVFHLSASSSNSLIDANARINYWISFLIQILFQRERNLDSAKESLISQQIRWICNWELKMNLLIHRSKVRKSLRSLKSWRFWLQILDEPLNCDDSFNELEDFGEITTVELPIDSSFVINNDKVGKEDEVEEVKEDSGANIEEEETNLEWVLEVPERSQLINLFIL